MYPTTNVYQRTFKLVCDDSQGACFTVDHDCRQYIVTAKHLVNSITNSTTIKIRRKDSWIDCPVNLVGHGKELIDISVLAADCQLSPTHPLPTNYDVITLGQDVYFLGFPYGLDTNIGELNRSFPVPFIKKAIFSARDTKLGVLYLDGQSNPGFSGGPVVFSNGQNPAKSLYVAGVISQRVNESVPVHREGNATCFESKCNAGIILAFEIKHAIRLIDENPIGYNLMQTGNG